MKPTVLLVDDHAVVREGLASLLSIGNRFDRILQASEGSLAVAMAAQSPVDIIVIDLCMPGMSGTEAIARLREFTPCPRIVVLTSSEDESLALSALKAGAQSYLVKSMSGDEILAALDRIMHGEEVIHPSVSHSILRMTLRNKEMQNPFELLTPRELHVLTELANGASNARIALALNITERTVKSHIGNVLSKLHLGDRTEAVAFAWRHGLMKQ